MKNQRKAHFGAMQFEDLLVWQARRPDLDLFGMFDILQRFNDGLSAAWVGMKGRQVRRRRRDPVVFTMMILTVLQFCFFVAFWGTGYGLGLYAGFFGMFTGLAVAAVLFVWHFRHLLHRFAPPIKRRPTATSLADVPVQASGLYWLNREA